jgi:hypothetical protein
MTAGSKDDRRSEGAVVGVAAVACATCCAGSAWGFLELLGSAAPTASGEGIGNTCG